jgi:hypothetical protein
VGMDPTFELLDFGSVRRKFGVIFRRLPRRGTRRKPIERD